MIRLRLLAATPSTGLSHPGSKRASRKLSVRPSDLVATNVRALSDARLLQGAKLDAVLCARSIKPLKVAAGGCGGCGLMAMGILSFRPSVSYGFAVLRK